MFSCKCWESLEKEIAQECLTAWLATRKMAEELWSFYPGPMEHPLGLREKTNTVEGMSSRRWSTKGPGREGGVSRTPISNTSVLSTQQMPGQPVFGNHSVS